MSLTGKDIYKKVLPKTNCGDCGIPSCFTFATTVVANKVPLKKCPHLDPETAAHYQKELDEQHSQEGSYVRKDTAKEALAWAQKRSASMDIKDLPERLGGELKDIDGTPVLELPYFNDTILIKPDSITKKDGSALNVWEQVFIYNHMAQGGSSVPKKQWISLQDIPNSTPKVQSMRTAVEEPLIKHFKGQQDQLLKAALKIGGQRIKETDASADLALLFQPLPRIPVVLLFWDELAEEGFDAQVKLLFDETIPEHLDIESILFLSERIAELLCEAT